MLYSCTLKVALSKYFLTINSIWCWQSCCMHVFCMSEHKYETFCLKKRKEKWLFALLIKSESIVQTTCYASVYWFLQNIICRIQCANNRIICGIWKISGLCLMSLFFHLFYFILPQAQESMRKKSVLCQLFIKKCPIFIHFHYTPWNIRFFFFLLPKSKNLVFWI